MPSALPPREDAVRLLRERFLNRTDFVAILAPWGKPCPVEANGSLDALLLGHVLGDGAPEAKVKFTNRRAIGAMSGRFRVGSYCPGPDDTTRWLCLDFDGAGHSDALADPQAAAIEALDAFLKAGLPAYLERSGGAKGWHLWCFFDPPLPAAKARELGRALAPKSAPLADGGVADVRSARGIELFPKQPKIRSTGYGNLVWLPWWQGASEGGNRFYRRVESGQLEEFAPTERKTAPVEAVHAAVAAVTPPPRPAARVDPPLGARTAHEGTWAAWRKRALAALAPEAVYGSLLTGKTSGAGWLQCRDPSSQTGDQNPSAGVADGTGEAERCAYHSFISGKTISVFDFLVAHGGAADFRAACARAADLAGVPLPAGSSSLAPTSEPKRQARPQIEVNNRQLRDVIADAWSAVHATNTRPSLFLRSSLLTRLAADDEDELHLESMGESATYGYLARIADWVRVTDDAVLNMSPVRDVARDMLAYPHAGLPKIEAVVSAPVYGRDGSLVQSAGYHASARLWLEPGGLSVPPVATSPSTEDVAAARSLLLDDLLVNFPFAAQSDRAHALAALILPFVRRMVPGCTPIHLVEAPSAGSGKGLLGDLVSILATGRTCEPTTFPSDENEARKKITSVLLKAPAVILLDNLRNGLDSAELAAALTAETWSDRLLGVSRMVDLPNRATWVATANNPNLSIEIARRCIRIRIDPKTDRPWLRTGFKHSPLRDWAKKNRGDLVHALLTLVQAWIAAGKPSGARVLGTFERWAETLGGILDVAGVPGLLGDNEELYDAADAEGREWRALVAAWWEKHAGAWVNASELLALVLERDLLGAMVGDKSPRSQKIRLGKALSIARDRRFGEFCLVVGRNSDGNAARYRLVKGSEEPSAAPAPAQQELEMQ